VQTSAPESSLKPSINHHSKRVKRETPKPEQWWGIPDGYKHPYDYMLYLWGTFFPEKPQPEVDDKRRRERVARRWQDRNFWPNVCRALEISATNDALKVEDWFNFDYVIRNPDTMQKMLSDWMRWKHDQMGESRQIEDIDFVDVTAIRLQNERGTVNQKTGVYDGTDY
jgi:hypothetical protein